MNKLTIIGNLTRDPELRTTPQGINVCDFTVAVNGRKQGDDATYFRVTVWRGLADVCAKYLAKGRKVCVVGPVSARSYQTQNGDTRVTLEVTAEDVEFLSGGQKEESYQPKERKQTQTEYIPVDEEIPF